MGRVITSVVAAVIGVLAVAGCGATTAATEPLGLTVEPPARGRAAIEPTDGRLGDATALRAGSPLRELSSGGRLDSRRRDDAPRRHGVGAGAACADADRAPSAESLPAMTEATLCLLNGERADHGLAPLAPNGKLAAAASDYARDLVAESYFSHTGRDGSDVRERIERSGYLPRGGGWALGENLAWGTGALATPRSIMRAWMNSPGHRENILEPDYREIGIGVVAGNPVAADGNGATYATEFGAIEGLEVAAAAATKRRTAARRAGKARKRARSLAKSRASRRARHPSR